jgi:hypothetical protein
VDGEGRGTIEGGKIPSHYLGLDVVE